MRKINFDNKDNDDDQLMIRLLKNQSISEPSDQFVEKTLVKLAFTKKRMSANSAVRLPLYLMMAITLLLFLPFLISLEPIDRNDSVTNLEWPALQITELVVTAYFICLSGITFSAFIILTHRLKNIQL